MYCRGLLTATGTSVAGVGAAGWLSRSGESVLDEVTATSWDLVVMFVDGSQIEALSLVKRDGVGSNGDELSRESSLWYFEETQLVEAEIE